MTFYHNYSFYTQPVLFLPRLSLYHESPQFWINLNPYLVFLDSRCYTGLQNDQKGQKHSMNHTADTSQYKYDIEQLLATGHPIRIKPQGYSMYPLFIPGRDEAVIEPVTPDKLHRNDVALYRRDRGILVLHRICRITKEGFYLVGDNQSEIEGPLRPDQFRGRLTEVIRNGRQFSVQNPLYRFLTSIWLFLCPVRPFFHRFCALLRRLHT